MKRWLGALLALAVLLVLRDARALDPSLRPSQYVLRSWSTDEGLLQKDVFGFAQTPDGYMWLATEEGLERFDGNRFVNFDATTAGFPNSDIEDVCLDGRGALWLATRGGGLLRRVDGESRVFGLQDGLPDLVVGHVACIADGAWASTGRGFARVEGGVVHAVPGALPWKDVEAIQPTPDGAWIATRNGLVRVENDVVVDAGNPALPTRTVSALHLEGDTLWLGGPGWIGTLVGSSLRAWTTKDGFSKGTPRSILRDHDGSLWISCEDDAVYRLSEDFGGFERFGVEAGLPDMATTSLFEDREGNLWVGTTGRGAIRLADPKIIALGKRDGITGDTVWGVVAAKNGDVWVGTRNGGVDRIRRDGSVDNFTKRDGLPSNTVFGGSEAPDGSIWLGTSAGAAHWVDGRFDVLTRANGLPHDVVHSAYVADDGTVWFGTSGGVTRYVAGVFSPLTVQQGMPSDHILEIDGDHRGGVWIGTDGGGLVHMTPNGMTVLTKSQGLADDGAHSVMVDADGTVWVATFHGLTRIRDGKLVSATTREGLCDDVVFSVLPGEQSTIWLATNRGIMKFPRDAFDRYARGESTTIEGVVVYGKSDGLADPECNGGMPAGARDELGRLWFAGLEGVLRVDPARVVTTDVEPRTIIESIDTKEASRAPVDGIAFTAGTRELTFRYTSPTFTAPERLRFRYRLVGYDSSWVDVGGRREAYFTNIGPGSYVFEVQAARADGTWGDSRTGVRFQVAAHFWQSSLFFVFVALAVGGAGVGASRLRVRALKQRAKELTQRVAERTSELAARDERIRSDLARARAFQQRTLPTLPEPGSLVFAAEYSPADEVGGDVYDVFSLTAETFRIFLADMTGHGIPAALRTMVLRTEYELLKRLSSDPARVLASLSARVHDVYGDLQMRCSGLCLDVTIDPNGGADVRYANALHPPILVARGDGSVEEIYEPGAYVGMLSSHVPTLRHFRIEPGDVLVLFTDGVYEQLDGAGRDLGFDAIIALVESVPRDAAAVARAIMQRVGAHAPSGIDDDVTVLCIAARVSRPAGSSDS